ncbi:MAG TPA: VOC family protein [Pseudonocardiaceae bacterium]|nr:VOC family protein [Pseudonocardiaceae bacterium]
MTWAGSIVAFLGVSDLDRAERFYGETLGLDLDDQRPFSLVAKVGATSLRITLVEQVHAAPYTVLGWNVPDIEATVDLLTLRGVSFNRYEDFEQDARGIWTAPSGARVAWFLDPDGNNLSVTQLS